VYIIASTAGSRVSVVGASVTGGSVAGLRVVGASVVGLTESSPLHAETEKVASRAKKATERRDDMRRVSHGAQLIWKLGTIKLNTVRIADRR
jgi:hypothetical protein